MNVRCKFKCTSVTKQKNWSTYRPEGAPPAAEFIYGYKFQPVTGNSDENKQFFASTPSGQLEMSAVRDDLFQPGKSYYLDFTPA